MAALLPTVVRGDYSIACMELSNLSHLRSGNEVMFNFVENLKEMAVKCLDSFNQLEIKLGRGGTTRNMVSMAENVTNQAHDNFVEAFKILKEILAAADQSEADAPTDLVN